MIDATITDRCAELATLITRHTDGKGDGFHDTTIEQLGFSRESAIGAVMHGISAPMLAIIVQGKKHTLMGEETYHYGAAQYLVVSIDVAISAVIGIKLSDAKRCQQRLQFEKCRIFVRWGRRKGGRCDRAQVQSYQPPASRSESPSQLKSA